MTTDYKEFLKFHRLLVIGRRGFQPFYFALAKGNKNPLPGKSWKDPANRLTAQQAVVCLKAGYNVGIAGTDKDDLVIIDIDDEEAVTDVKPSLSDRSRKRTGRHYFYFSSDKRCKQNIPTEDCGEVRSLWQYVVAPGSYVETKPESLETPVPDSQLPFLGKYTLDTEMLPTSLTYEEFPKIFREHAERSPMPKENTKQEGEIRERREFNGRASALFKLSITDVCGDAPTWGNFPSLFHGSKTGQNNTISHGLLHCWRHNVSHTALSALAVKAGLGDCSSLGKPHKDTLGAGGFDIKNGELIYKLWTYARENGLIPIDDRMPMSAFKWRLGINDKKN